MTKLTDIAIEVMREEKIDYIGYSQFGLLDEVFHRAKEGGVV